MKILELAQKLKAIYDKEGDVEVMFQEPNGEGDLFAAEEVEFRVAEKDEFPDYYDMPKGFKFILLSN